MHRSIRQLHDIRTLALVAGLAAALAMACPASAQPSCTVSWADPSDGDWNTPGNWDTGLVPGEFDDVCIVAEGNYTVTLNGSAMIGTLTVGNSGAGGNQTLRVEA